MKFSVVLPLWQDRPPQENLAVAKVADSLGYPGVWIGEMATYDAFALATAVGLSTQQVALNIGPLAVSVRTPMTLAMGAASVRALTGRDVGLAIGASSVVVVKQWHGRERRHTARHLAESAQILRSLLDGQKANFDGELARCKGYRLRLDAPGSPLTIAAFGDGAIRAAARHADRMLLNMVTPTSLRQLRDRLEEAASDAGRATPSVSVWLPCAVDPGEAAIAQLKRGVVGYLAAPGYSQMMMEAGFGELVEYARNEPHPRHLLDAMPDELIGAIGLVGSDAEVKSRIEAYRDAGADEICLVPATADDDAGTSTLETLVTLS